MTKEIVEAKENSFSLTAEDVRKFFCEKATEKEIAMFLNIAKLNNLNPFNREIYIVKYGSYPASILTGYEVYLKRAERTGKYAGFKVWTEGEIPNMKACIEVYRKDWDKPLIHEVEYSEYVGKTSDGKPTRFWKDKPRTMLKKVAISQAFRFAFPDELAGMPYTQDEVIHNQDEVIHNQQSITVPSISTESNKTNGNGPNFEDHVKIEEMVDQEFDGLKSQNTSPEESEHLISEAQRRKLFSIAKENKWSKDDLKGYLRMSYNITSTKDIPKSKFDGIINFLTTLKD